MLATPLRLGAALEASKVELGAVRYLILDEADKLFDLKFTEQVDAAIAACSNPSVVCPP